MDNKNLLPPKAANQLEVKMTDFVIGAVKYREIELTPDILPLFDRLKCDDIMHLDDSNSDSCRAKKNVLIGLAGGYWRLFHRDSAEEHKLKGSIKLLSTAPAGVDMQKLASEDPIVAKAEMAKLKADVATKEAEKANKLVESKDKEIAFAPQSAELVSKAINTTGSVNTPNESVCASHVPPSNIYPPVNSSLSSGGGHAETIGNVCGPLPIAYSQPAHQASTQKRAQSQAMHQRQMPLEAQQQQISTPDSISESLLQLNEALLNCPDEGSKQILLNAIHHVVSTAQDAASATAQTPQYPKDAQGAGTQMQPDTKANRPPSQNAATAPHSASIKQNTETHSNASLRTSGCMSTMNPQSPPFFSPVPRASHPMGGPSPFSGYPLSTPSLVPKRYEIPSSSILNGGSSGIGPVTSEAGYGGVPISTLNAISCPDPYHPMMQGSSLYGRYPTMAAQGLPPPLPTFVCGRSPFVPPAQSPAPLLTSGNGHSLFVAPAQSPSPLPTSGNGHSPFVPPAQSPSPLPTFVNGRSPYISPQISVNDIWCGTRAIPGSWPTQSPSPLHIPVGTTASQTPAGPFKVAPATPVEHTREQMDDCWAEAKTSEGKVYYYNKLTKATQWERPPQYKAPLEYKPAQKYIFRGKAIGGYQAGRPYPQDYSEIKKTEAVLDKSIAPDNTLTTEKMPIRTKPTKAAPTTAETIKMAREAASEQAKKMEESRKHMLAMMKKQGRLSEGTEVDAAKDKLPSADMAKLAKVLLRKEVTTEEQQGTKGEMKGPKVEKAISRTHKKVQAEQTEILKKVRKGKESSDWELVGDEEMDDDYVFA